jgi:hypothetical protein
VSESIELLLRILAGVLPVGVVEGAYLFGQTEPNQESLFATGRELAVLEYLRTRD